MRYKKDWNKKQRNSYRDYLKRYHKQKKYMESRGEQMADRTNKPLSQDEYELAKEQLKQQGRTTSINAKIVSEQAFKVSRRVVMAYKQKVKEILEAQKHEKPESIYQIVANEEIEELIKSNKEQKIREFMLGNKTMDLSLINDILKLEQPNWTGYDRQEYISHYVFGSK